MPPNSRYTFEICVDSPGAVAAAAPFADRIELCAALGVGGLTPDAGLIAFAVSRGIQTHVLIRPRDGDFTMNGEDLDVATSAIAASQSAGARGVVIGAEKDGELDCAALRIMIAAAGDMDVTLHRVIDIVDDPFAALETAIDLGLARVLTSGGASRAVEGCTRLVALHEAARGRIEIMAGAGIDSVNLPQLLARTPLTSFHASCSRPTSPDTRIGTFGFGGGSRSFDPREAQRIVGLLCG